MRKIHKPSKYKDLHVTYPSSTATNHSTGTSLYPFSYVLSFAKSSSSYHHVVLSITQSVEPQSYSEASKDPNCIEAMNAEIKALELNDVRVLTNLPQHKTTIGCKWAYKIKNKFHGSIERYKARLVAKWYTQVEGQDYPDTFSPIAKLTIVRLLPTLDAINQWHLQQLDVNNVFLHGDLNGEVYMVIPHGMQVARPGQVCKLQMSLYGLK